MPSVAPPAGQCHQRRAGPCRHVCAAGSEPHTALRHHHQQQQQQQQLNSAAPSWRPLPSSCLRRRGSAAIAAAGPGGAARSASATAAASKGSSSSSSMLQGSVEPSYLAAAAYLAQLGFANKTEIARVLDIAMNPDSLFVTASANASARPLTVRARVPWCVFWGGGGGRCRQLQCRRCTCPCTH
jgi:hypothetical protein